MWRSRRRSDEGKKLKDQKEGVPKDSQPRDQSAKLPLAPGAKDSGASKELL